MSNKMKTTDANYTNVSFEEIKQKLIERAKRYYPDTYQDFNHSSFGSLMMDLVSMVGEQLNFYTQFVANENFIETSRTSQGLVSAARNSGIEIFNKYTSVGNVKVYSRIPANASLSAPDTSYQHTVLKGMIISSDSGAVYTTTQDVSLVMTPENLISSEFTEDSTRTAYYTYQMDVPVISGENRTISVDVGSYQKFLKIEIRDTTITEVLSVLDDNGNEYYQVENLSQDTVYREVTNVNNTDNLVSHKLVALPVPRRFVIQHEGEKTFLVFGFGSEDSLKKRSIADPASISLDMEGKKYISDLSFDPSKLLESNKYGVAPQNTILTITYRSSTLQNSNTGAKTLNNIVSSEILFPNEADLDPGVMQYIKNSLSCENLEPINGSLKFTTTQEVAETIKSSRGFRGRAVTLHDYISACYAMPSKFGSIRRASIYRDKNDLKRNLNLYIISQDQNSKLQKPSPALRNNLKKWLNSVRMVSDTIDIFSAEILNLGIFFDVSLNLKSDQVTAMSEIREKLFYEMNLSTPDIGEGFSLGDVEAILNSMSIVSRVNSVKVSNKYGAAYSEIRYGIDSNMSPDGGLLHIPENFIWEIKNESDITGKIQ